MSFICPWDDTETVSSGKSTICDTYFLWCLCRGPLEALALFYPPAAVALSSSSLYIEDAGTGREERSHKFLCWKTEMTAWRSFLRLVMAAKSEILLLSWFWSGRGKEGSNQGSLTHPGTKKRKCPSQPSFLLSTSCLAKGICFIFNPYHNI